MLWPATASELGRLTNRLQVSPALVSLLRLSAGLLLGLLETSTCCGVTLNIHTSGGVRGGTIGLETQVFGARLFVAARRLAWLAW